jgi:beta-phosphoglucomutase
MPVRAVAFDFNGTLSDDEPILYAVYAELFAEQGRPLSERDYYGELAGHHEEEIFRRWLGHSDPALIAERIARYRERTRDGTTIDEDARAAVCHAAERVPVGVVSGAALEEIEPVLTAAGLAESIDAIVAGDQVSNGKPHPEGYLRAVELLGAAPGETLAFEDTDAGLASAKSAGLRVVGVTRTLGAERLALADELIHRLDAAALTRFLP